MYYTVCVFSKCGVEIYSRIGNKGLYFPTFFQFLFFHFFFCFLLHNISTYLLKNCFVMFLFYHIINHFCLSYSYEKNSFFYELKVQYHLWLIRSFGVYAYCICICQGHIIAFTKSYCFKIHSQNTSRVYQLVNVYGLI